MSQPQRIGDDEDRRQQLQLPQQGHDLGDASAIYLPEGYTPSASDVCCGRGKKNWNHQGNITYRGLIRSKVEAYQTSGKRERSNIVQSILRTIRERGGKFVKQETDSGRWIDIGSESALEKVDHSLRDQAAPQEPEETLAGPVDLPENYQPKNADVCCGRGKKNWNHDGNVWFRDFIRSKVKQYQDAVDKHEKTTLIRSIVEAVRQRGGKFVKQDEKTKRWYDIGESQSRDKVDHSLRDQVYHGSSPSRSTSEGQGSSKQRGRQREPASPPSPAANLATTSTAQNDDRKPAGISRKRPRSTASSVVSSTSAGIAASSSAVALSSTTAAMADNSSIVGGQQPQQLQQQATGIPPGVQVAPLFQGSIPGPLVGANPQLANIFGGLSGGGGGSGDNPRSMLLSAALAGQQGRMIPPVAQGQHGASHQSHFSAAATASSNVHGPVGGASRGLLMSPSVPPEGRMQDFLEESARRGELSTPGDDDMIPMTYDELFTSSEENAQDSPPEAIGSSAGGHPPPPVVLQQQTEQQQQHQHMQLQLQQQRLEQQQQMQLLQQAQAQQMMMASAPPSFGDIRLPPMLGQVHQGQVHQSQATSTTTSISHHADLLHQQQQQLQQGVAPPASMLVPGQQRQLPLLQVAASQEEQEKEDESSAYGRQQGGNPRGNI